MRYRSALLGLFVAVPASAAEQAKLEYNRDIRPILAENCFACHGPDSAARKAGLRLDQRDAAIAKKALVPGRADESELVERIASDDPTDTMPPPETNKHLKPAQIALLKRWINDGAEYQPHWSFIAPKRPELPAVKNAAWVRNPIDRFVLAELEKRNLSPAPEADRHTLLRRLALDVTGLPPEPKDVLEFAADPSPQWIDRYIDKLMASELWGEHRGRYWLDAARYGDTHGIHFDNYREIWAYRDWVIQAFNANRPFDKFTVDQLAGDLLPKPTLDQKIATGFNRCNITTNEGGSIAEEYLVLYNRDRTETVSQVWLGLTTGCAVCHDHKFDPISQKEFYSLAAFFNNTVQGAMDGNIKDTPPSIPVPARADRARWNEIAAAVEAAKAKIAERKKAARKEFDGWLAGATPEQAAAWIPTGGMKFHAWLAEGKGTEIHAAIDGKEEVVKAGDGFVWVKGGKLGETGFQIKNGAPTPFPTTGDFDTRQPFTVSFWIKTTQRGISGAAVARMDESDKHRGWDIYIDSDRVATHLIHSWPDNAVKVISKNALKLNEWHQVVVSHDGSAKAGGVRITVDGAAQAVEVANDNLKPDSTTRTKAPFQLGQRSAGGRTANVVLGDVRLYDRKLDPSEVERLAKGSHAAEVLGKAKDKRTKAEIDELYEAWLNVEDKPYRELQAESASIKEEELRIRSRGTMTHVMSEKPGEPIAYILNRGEYDQRRDKVTADVPRVLPPMEKGLPRNRLGFAEWLLKPEHPLTARVTVNRFWQEVFGNGLVRTSGDFGTTGEPPSHPELLDWLAVEFREQGWDMKKFFKLILTSATYRQAAIATKEKLEADPSNKWLSRGPRFRMDAEMVRDYALAASGLLVRQIGGPSVRPYQPEGVWEAVAMPGSDTRSYKRDSGEKLYRRSMYTLWKRAAPPASMEIMNAPNRETCAVRRERTNTPLQALVTMNDTQFVEADRVLAERILNGELKDDTARFQRLGLIVLGREFMSAELKILSGSLASLISEFKAKPGEAKKLIAVGEAKVDAKLDAVTLAAWTMLTNQVLNLDEALNK